MKSLRILDRRAGFSFASIVVLLAMVLPAAFPAFASAYTVLTARSIAMSNSAALATPVNYKVSFTPSIAIASGGGFIVDFCQESPVLGQTCTTPAGFTAAAAVNGTVSTAGTLTASVGRLKFVGSAIIPLSAVSYEFTGVTNPNAVGTFYARIYTYTSANIAGNTGPTVLGTAQDAGGIALSATNVIAITATVQETMTFCTTVAIPTANCANSAAVSLVLGSGVPVVLGTTVQTGTGYMSISTNANSGALVNMTNSNNCGGLRRVAAGAAACDIAPTNTSTALTGGEGKFGLTIGASTIIGGSGGSGTLTALAPYNTAAQYGMTYAGVSTGVSSTYGDTIANTASGPVSNAYAQLTFAADASNVTPAGVYSANMNLIATGTF